MANSPSHKFGQMIGDLLELTIGPHLEEFANKHGLFLDRKGKVRSCRSGKKISWKDHYGNTHDLDFVLEKGGSDKKLGVPVAFIECAWRRYTKHSPNKAQEIQGAILPLSETHKNHGPFLGAILAGVFTEGALQQLRSNGFAVFYISYESVVEAFSKVNVDASFDEQTSDALLSKKIKQWEALSSTKIEFVSKALFALNKTGFAEFSDRLQISIERKIQSIQVIPLHGKSSEMFSVVQATDLVSDYAMSKVEAGFQKYEITIKFNNGSRIERQFSSREETLDFLRIYG